MSRLITLLAIITACAWSMACGPAQSTVVINEAEVALERAMLAGAEKKAPYEYYSATEYLEKAKEEWAYSDFEAALDYAALSKQFSEEAKKKVEGVSEGFKPGKKKSEPETDPADELEGLP